MKFKIEIPDLTNLIKMDEAYYAARNKFFKIAMEKAVDDVAGEVKDRIPRGLTGRTVGSIKGTVVMGSIMGSAEPISKSSIIGKVGSNMSYPDISIYVLNSGRKPNGKMPPPKKLESWIGSGYFGQTISQTAFIIARSIARNGVKGLHFFSLGLKAARTKIDNYFSQAVNDILEEISRPKF